MKNEFVTYEQALALKELGFDEQCFGGYAKDDKTLYIGYDAEFGEHFFRDFYIRAPLKQQALRWFREKYKIRFFIQSAMADSGEYFKLLFPNGEQRGRAYDTYEEAENACIDKLIEIAKQ
jgi:hypothetical protein